MATKKAKNTKKTTKKVKTIEKNPKKVKTTKMVTPISTRTVASFGGRRRVGTKMANEEGGCHLLRVSGCFCCTSVTFFGHEEGGLDLLRATKKVNHHEEGDHQRPFSGSVQDHSAQPVLTDLMLSAWRASFTG